MAAPKVDIDDEKKMNETQKDMTDNIVIPDVDKSILEKAAKDIQELYKYKAKWNINDNGSVTFWPTPNCVASKKKFGMNKISMDTMLQKQNCSKAAAYSDPDKQVVQSQYDTTCSFITSSLTAWSEHYPFRFRVEHIWLLILQAVAVHVDQNAEKLRNKYVTHSGKKELTVDVSPNPSYQEWINVIKQFASQIDKNTVNDTCKLFECDFSTSSLTEKIATKVTIMDVCKNYFEYGMMTCCGFPQITLDGNKEDWIQLKQKTVKLLNEKVDKKFGVEWSKSLLPLLDRFIVAFDGQIDCVFWNSMIKRGAWHGSGAWSWYSGWFNILFPFIKQRPNKFCEPYSMEQSYVAQGLEASGRGNDRKYYPTGLASAPVEWDNNGTKIDMKFFAGFVGYTQDQNTLEICPNISWCVAYANKK